MHGGAAVSFHAFLISAPDACVCLTSQSGTQSGPRTRVTLCRTELILVPPYDRTHTARSPTGCPVTTATSNSRGSDKKRQSRGSSPPPVTPTQSVISRTPRRINSVISNEMFVIIYFYVWPLLPAYYRRRGLLLFLISLSVMHTQNSSAQVISPSQGPLPHNTQHSQQTDIHTAGGNRTHNPSK
jgi:hypothetical protein